MGTSRIERTYLFFWKIRVFRDRPPNRGSRRGWMGELLTVAISFKVRFFRRLVAATALVLGCVHGAPGALKAADLGGYGAVVFTGFDAREKTYYPYLGVRYHVNGDLLSDGPLLRLFGYYARYEYSSAAVAGGEVDADVFAFDAMVGYQKFIGSLALRAYVGLDYENHDLSPDNPFDSNRGGDFGVKVQGEAETDWASPYYGNLIGSFGTAKDRYWSRVRLGYDFAGHVVGPEGHLMGDNEHDEQRIGAFILLKSVGPLTISAGAGYSDTNDNRGGGSPYGTIEFSTVF